MTPITLVAFWLFFLPRHAWFGTAFLVLLIVVSTGFGIYSYQLAAGTLSGTVKPADQEKDEPLWTWIWSSIRNYRPDRWAKLVLALALVLSGGAALAPGRDLLAVLGSPFGIRTSANLREAELSLPPSDWTGDLDRIKGADLRGKDLRRADLTGAFLVKARLEGADLRGANLSGADLRSAQLQDAMLDGAQLQGANLSGADLRGAKIQGANFEGACRDPETRLPKASSSSSARKLDQRIELQRRSGTVRNDCSWSRSSRRSR